MDCKPYKHFVANGINPQAVCLDQKFVEGGVEEKYFIPLSEAQLKAFHRELSLKKPVFESNDLYDEQATKVNEALDKVEPFVPEEV